MPFFFFNDTATTEIYTLSLHDALPICRAATTAVRGATSAPAEARRAASRSRSCCRGRARREAAPAAMSEAAAAPRNRSEEHTSELQSRLHLVCRLLLEKKKIKIEQHTS